MPPTLDDAALKSFLDLVFDFVCARPLSDFVDANKVLPALDEALRADRVEEFQKRVAFPVRERLLQRAEKSALKMEAWLPKDVAQRIDEKLGKPVKIPQKVIDDVATSEKLREGVRTTLNEALTNFVAKATGGDSAAGQGLRGAIGFAKAASKGLFGGIGEEIQKRMQEKVKDFVDASVASVQKKIADRLASDETSKALGKRRQEAFRKFLATTEVDAAKTIRKSRPDEIDRELPAIVAHNLARAEVRDALREELATTIAELSKESIGQHLERAGVKSHARDAVRAHGLPLARAFVATPELVAWWTKLHP